MEAFCALCLIMTLKEWKGKERWPGGKTEGTEGRAGGKEGGGFIEYQMTQFGRHNKGSLPGGAASPQGTDPIIASLYLIFTLTLPSENKTVLHATQSDLLISLIVILFIFLYVTVSWSVTSLMLQFNNSLLHCLFIPPLYMHGSHLLTLTTTVGVSNGPQTFSQQHFTVQVTPR